MNYYNEWDSFSAEWLKELIKDDLIPNGEVDSRSIIDVEPEDLKGFAQCHFFAGIGGWSRALQIAGWSPDRPVWTGSPPCQSFSTAGSRKGKDDERHLWPVFFNLIRECQPPTVFGEQVAAAIRFGWLDDLQADFEKEGYAAGSFVLPAGSIGAPHKRDRLFFVADSKPERFQRRLSGRSNTKRQNLSGHIGRCGATDSVGNSDSNRPESRDETAETAGHWDSIDAASFWSESVGDSKYDGSYGAEVGRSPFETSNCGKKGQDVSCESEGAGRSEIARDIRFWEDSTTIYCRDGKNRPISTNSVADSSSKQKHQEQQKPAENEGKRSAINNSRCSVDDEGLWDLWENSQIIYCRDGKYRPIPIEPSLFPLADGISNRVGILRGAGNAIVPQAAAEIIKAVM
jgi:DNA (cytosine-5)-methyltransferase 1